MRNLKRFLAMALTMLMLVTSLSIVTSAKFEDVTDFQNEIAVLAQLGVIKGKADGTFGFDEPVTRRQTALFFARATTGKVDDALHWQSKVNTTPFKDLDAENDYYGAISYCHNNGIVKGRSTTEFAPNDNITFKEAITMAVRALGYKGADMDAGYPWSYYSKAVTLGLDKGIEDVGLDDVVTRGVMAKLIYNMMFATNSEGTTIAAKAFGSAVKTTVLVLVAAKGKTLVKNLDTSVESNSKLAAFVELNDDGTFNYDKVYHFDWATFAELAYGEGNEEKAVDHVGYSYTVVTLDNLKSLVTVSENPVKKLTSADYVGDGKLEGTEYELVQKWSSVFNIGATKTGKEELIQYNTAFHDGKSKLANAERKVYYGGYYYVVDKDNNILAEDGRVLLYYYESIDKEKIVELGSTIFPYYYNVGNLYYPAILPANTRYPGAATVEQLELPKAPITYNSNKNGTYAKNVSAYADTIVFDDNNDGVFDRAYFTAYVFGKLKVQDDDTGDGKLDYYFYIGANGDNKYIDVRGADKVINLTDVELKKDTTYYVLWAHDAVNGTVTVKKVYDEVKYGYVVAVDVVNDTITFANTSWFGIGVGNLETIKYGVSKLPGATNTNKDLSIKDDGDGELKTEVLVGVDYSLLNKYVSYIVDEENDGRIIAVFGAEDANTPLVITKVDRSYYTLGTLRATVIDNSGNRQIISISSIDGVPVLNWFNFNKDNILNILNEGQLVLGSQQKDGTWIVSTKVELDPVETKKDKDTVYEYINGYAYNDDGKFVHKADGSKLVIVVAEKDTKNNNTTYSYKIANAVSVNGAKVTFKKDGAARVYIKKNGYMFIDAPKDTVVFNDKWNVIDSGWQVGTASDVIYLASVSPAYTGNQYGTYLYTGNFFSILTGAKNTDVGSALYSNVKLEAGNFYHVTKVKDGDNTIVVVLGDAIKNGYENAEYFKEVYVKSYNKDNRVITIADQYGNDIGTIKGKEPKYIDWKESTPSVDKAPKSKGENQLYKAYYYYKEPLYGTTDKVYFLVTDTVNILSNPKLVGIKVDPTGTLVAGTTVKVKSVTIEINGTKVSYEPSKLPFPAIYIWYRVEDDQKPEEIVANFNKTSYTTTKDDVGKTIRVEVYLPGYEGTASYDFENIIEYRLISLTVMADNEVVEDGGEVAKDATLTISKVTDMFGADVDLKDCTITWTLKDNNDNDIVVGNSNTLALGNIENIEDITVHSVTVTVTCKGSTLNWTATVTDTVTD